MIESYTFVGRTKKPIALKLNPVWWLMNDDEQTVDEAPWYLPSRPYWWRWACWGLPATSGRAGRNDWLVITGADVDASLVDLSNLYPTSAALREPIKPICRLNCQRQSGV